MVVPTIEQEGPAEFVSSLGETVAFMDADADPTESHRHRIALALERGELRGYDL